jgi:hypothetical protein
MGAVIKPQRKLTVCEWRSLTLQRTQTSSPEFSEFDEDVASDNLSLLLIDSVSFQYLCCGLKEKDKDGESVPLIRSNGCLLFDYVTLSNL